MKKLWLPVVTAREDARCSLKCKMLLHHSKMNAKCIARGLEGLQFDNGFLRTAYCKQNAREVK